MLHPNAGSHSEASPERFAHTLGSLYPPRRYSRTSSQRRRRPPRRPHPPFQSKQRSRRRLPRNSRNLPTNTKRMYA